jgi:hypothetical protein
MAQYKQPQPDSLEFERGTSTESTQCQTVLQTRTRSDSTQRQELTAGAHTESTAHNMQSSRPTGKGKTSTTFEQNTTHRLPRIGFVTQDSWIGHQHHSARASLFKAVEHADCTPSDHEVRKHHCGQQQPSEVVDDNGFRRSFARRSAAVIHEENDREYSCQRHGCSLRQHPLLCKRQFDGAVPHRERQTTGKETTTPSCESTSNDTARRLRGTIPGQ